MRRRKYSFLGVLLPLPWQVLIRTLGSMLANVTYPDTEQRTNRSYSTIKITITINFIVCEHNNTFKTTSLNGHLKETRYCTNKYKLRIFMNTNRVSFYAKLSKNYEIYTSITNLVCPPPYVTEPRSSASFSYWLL
jgi:hypothetical protein